MEPKSESSMDQELHSKVDALFDQNQILLELLKALTLKWENFQLSSSSSRALSHHFQPPPGDSTFLAFTNLEVPPDRPVENENEKLVVPPEAVEVSHGENCGFHLQRLVAENVGNNDSPMESDELRPPGAENRCAKEAKRNSARMTFVRRKLSEHQQKAEAESIRQRSVYSENSVDDEVPKTCKEQLGRVVSSHYFSFCIMTLIFINLVLLGIEVDVSASLGQNDIPRWFETVNFVIVAIFLLELLLKMYTRGCHAFFAGDDGGWNIFDLCIVVVSLLESVISSQMELSHLRVMRFARLVKTLRGVRVMRLLHYISALRTLARSILNTMRSLFWTLVLLLLAFYSFALIFTQAVVDHCRSEAVIQTGDPNAIPLCSGRLDRYWSSIPQSMLTLFMSITGGLSWIDALEALTSFSFFALTFFVIYIVITVFAVLNVVTGVFCNTAIESAAADKEIAAITQLKKQQDLSQSLREIFDEIDVDNSNTVTLDEFRDALTSTKLSNFLESLGISTADAWTLFALMDVDQSGDIELDEFVSTCMDVNGPAKSYQIAQMSRENKMTRRAIKQMSTMMSEMKTQLGRMV